MQHHQYQPLPKYVGDKARRNATHIDLHSKRPFEYIEPHNGRNGKFRDLVDGSTVICPMSFVRNAGPDEMVLQ